MDHLGVLIVCIILGLGLGPCWSLVGGIRRHRHWRRELTTLINYIQSGRTKWYMVKENVGKKRIRGVISGVAVPVCGVSYIAWTKGRLFETSDHHDAAKFAGISDEVRAKMVHAFDHVPDLSSRRLRRYLRRTLRPQEVTRAQYDQLLIAEKRSNDQWDAALASLPKTAGSSSPDPAHDKLVAV